MEKFQNIISDAVKSMASDVYITGGHPIVIRRHGNIQFQDEIGYSHMEMDSLVSKLMNPRQLQELREKKSYDLSASVSNARLRINVFTTTRGLSLAIRLLPGRIPTIDELNLHPSLNEIAKIKSGLVLVCGRTGGGKTTTIASLIDEINRTRMSHIVTLENPIEYKFKTNKAFIQQRELGEHTPSFAQGLVDVLRENPDVVVVGELRDAEVMKLAIDAAQSGHLVIATIHASSPEDAIYRLCNSVKVEAQDEIRYQLASTLKWLIVQQLVHLEKVGYRVPLLTILRTNTAIKNTIRENRLQQLPNAISTGKTDGMFDTERYFDEYLISRKNFTHPDTVFNPSFETAHDNVYQSPLTGDAPKA